MGRGRNKQVKVVEPVAEKVEQPVAEKPVEVKKEVQQEQTHVAAPEPVAKQEQPETDDVNLKVSKEEMQEAIEQVKKQDEARRLQALTNISLGIFNSFIMSGAPMSDGNREKKIDLSFKCAEEFLDRADKLKK